jgi:hypothetical protein
VVVSVFFNGVWWQDGVGPPTTVTLDCTAASVSPSEVVVMNPQAFVFEQAFILSQIPGNINNVCTVTAAPIPGYTTKYECGTQGYSDLWEECDDVDSLPADEDEKYSDVSCVFDDIQIDDVGGCVIDHNVDPVEVAVTKSWEFSGAEADYTSLDVDIDVYCNARIKDYDYKSGSSYWRRDFSLDDSDYGDDQGEGDLEATVTVWVYPNWYPTAADPKNQVYTKCWATEDITDSSVETTNACGTSSSNAKVKVSVGGSDQSCTITNTVFFEGIPTLNQYGMAIMALLMLGVGFVGFRRFV